MMCWFLLYMWISHRNIYVPPSWTSLPPPTPPHASRLSQSSGFELPASSSKFLSGRYFYAFLLMRLLRLREVEWSIHSAQLVSGGAHFFCYPVKTQQAPPTTPANPLLSALGGCHGCSPGRYCGVPSPCPNLSSKSLALLWPANPCVLFSDLRFAKEQAAHSDRPVSSTSWCVQLGHLRGPQFPHPWHGIIPEWSFRVLPALTLFHFIAFHLRAPSHLWNPTISGGVIPFGWPVLRCSATFWQCLYSIFFFFPFPLGQRGFLASSLFS